MTAEPLKVMFTVEVGATWRDAEGVDWKVCRLGVESVTLERPVSAQVKALDLVRRFTFVAGPIDEPMQGDSGMREGLVSDAQFRRLCNLHRKGPQAAAWVARICDEALDPSGALLGRIRFAVGLRDAKEASA